MWIQSWSSAFMKNEKVTPVNEQSLGRIKTTKSILRWRAMKAIAFPLCTFEHWTLGVLINKSWAPGFNKPPAEWIGLHMDSLPQANSIHIAKAVGQHILGINDRNLLEFRKVPVPLQPFGSLDCGLYVSHYLYMVLGDLDFFLKYCQVSMEKCFAPELTSPKDNTITAGKSNDDVWMGHITRFLRKDALYIFDFYKKASEISTTKLYTT